MKHVKVSMMNSKVSFHSHCASNHLLSSININALTIKNIILITILLLTGVKIDIIIIVNA